MTSTLDLYMLTLSVVIFAFQFALILGMHRGRLGRWSYGQVTLTRSM
jgi:hypothetical protein